LNVKYWYILWAFGILCGILCGHLIYVFIFSYVVQRKIWQPRFRLQKYPQ
jgi:hypothetical protein